MQASASLSLAPPQEAADPQAVRSFRLLVMQTSAPDEQLKTPVRQGSSRQLLPARQPTQAPPLHTLSVPQLVPLPQSGSSQSTLPSQSSS